MPYADLHIHSTVSDGTMTPEEIVREAKRAGVGLLAISDHDLIAGSMAVKPLCKEAGIGYLSAVENTCSFENTYHHVLSYGVDLTEEHFLSVIRHNRARHDEMSVELIRRMKTDYPSVSLEEYDGFERDVRLGGWKALHYFLDKGITETFHGGRMFYKTYNVTYPEAGFLPLETLVEAIHGAGGRAVLAHPGKTIPTEDLAVFEAELIRLIDLGLDGVECYYPSHTEEIMNICLRACDARGLMITTGSDCHGTFSGAPIGSMRVEVERIRLNGLQVE